MLRPQPEQNFFISHNALIAGCAIGRQREGDAGRSADVILRRTQEHSAVQKCDGVACPVSADEDTSPILLHPDDALRR
jgi:hypothetical protein